MSEPNELAVVFRAGDHVYGASLARIERLILATEIEPVAAGEGGVPPVVAWKGERYAGWDLAALFGYSAAAESCLLLRLPHGPRWVSVALAAGACLKVTPIGRIHGVPPGAVVRRQTAVGGVFSTRGQGEGLPPLGLYLDLVRLLSPAELDACEAAFAGAKA